MRRFLKWSLVLAAVLLCAAAGMAQVAPPANLFELDGTAGPVYTTNPFTPPPPSSPQMCSYGGASVPCDYWNLLNGTGAVGTALPYNSQLKAPYLHSVINSFVTSGTGSPNFTGGGSKDPNDVSQWNWTIGNTPDKNTITNGYAAAYVDSATGHTVLMYGADRFSTSGDANFGAWFFQQNVAPVAGGTFSGNHVDGDVFLISAFTNGGGTSTITVFLWDHTCSASNYPAPTTLPACAATNLKEVYASTNVCAGNPTCAVTNASNETVTWNYQAKLNSGTGASVLPPGVLFTGGIDLTFMFTQAGISNVPCLSSFIMDTRASQSPSAVLKDFVGGSFPLCGIQVAKSCSAVPTIVPNTSGTGAHIHYAFDGYVKNTGAGNVFNLQVVDTFPAGAFNTVFNQPVTPGTGLAKGQTATFSGSFDYNAQGTIQNIVDATAAACASGCANTVTGDTTGPAHSAASFGSSTPVTDVVTNQSVTCQISTNPLLTLGKGCVVTLAQTANVGVVLKLVDTITVCNKSPDGTTTINGVTLTNNVLGGPIEGGPNFVISVGTLTPAQCVTLHPTYTPTSCVTTDGVCSFSDTVSLSSVPTDEFGTPVPASQLPAPHVAACRICPAGVCSTITP